MTKLLILPYTLLMAIGLALIIALGIVLAALMAPIFEVFIKTNPPKFYEYGKE